MAERPQNRENTPVETTESDPHDDPNSRIARPDPRDPAAPGGGTAPTPEEPGSKEESTSGKAKRPGPLPEEEGRPGRETGAADEGWIRPADKDKTANPRPGQSGSQQGLEEE